MDRLLDSYLGKKIDRDTTKICLGDSIDPEEIDRVIDLTENDDSEWDIHAVDYGIALAACLITKYGKSISVEESTEIEPNKNKITISEATSKALKNVDGLVMRDMQDAYLGKEKPSEISLNDLVDFLN